MTIVTAAVIWRSGKVLLTRRAGGGKHEGFWEFPGGKVEQGESLKDCLERELLEELGVKSDVGDVLCMSEFEYDHGAIKLVALETRLVSSEFNLKDHDRIEWVSPKDLLDYQLLPADIPIAASICDAKIRVV